MQRLAKRVKQSSLNVSEVQVDPQGEIKMSTVLEQFVDPYWPEARTHQERIFLLNIAVSAWNMALLEENERLEQVNSLVSQLSPDPSNPVADEIREMFMELIERKQTLFSTIDRLIVDFELDENRYGANLSVVSTPANPISPETPADGPADDQPPIEAEGQQDS